MKRISVIALSLFYILSTLGVLVTSNCCNGKAMSVSVNEWSGKTCRCSATAPAKKCCSKKMHWLKLDDNHQVPATSKLPFNPQSFISGIFPEQLKSELPPSAIGFISSDIHGPPKEGAIPLYLFLSDFRI